MAALAASPDPPAPARFGLVNARLLVKKTFILKDFLTSELNFLFVTETWLSVGESSAFTEILPAECCYFNSQRTSGRGGGIALNVGMATHNGLHFLSNYHNFYQTSRHSDTFFLLWSEWRYVFFFFKHTAFPTVPFNSLFFYPKYFALMICRRKYALKFGREQFAFVLRLNE